MTHARNYPRGEAPAVALAAGFALLVGCGSVTEIESDAAGGGGDDAAASDDDASSPASDAADPAETPDADVVTFPDDPLLYLSFDDQSFDNQASGEIGVSSSFTEPDFATDRFGFGEQALDMIENFNSDFYLALASDPLEVGNEVTMAVWFQGESFGNNERIVGIGEWFALQFESSDTVRFGAVDILEPGEPGVVDSTPIDPEAWTFLAGVVEQDGEGTTIRLYRDGELVSEETFGEVPSAPQCRFYVGTFDQGNLCDSLNEPQKLHGFVDDVRLYDRALSAEEIELLYREGGWPDI